MSDKYGVDLSSAVWFKSSRSSARKECVEVAFLDGGLTGVRDSKNPDGGVLVFTPSQWDGLIRHLSSNR